MTAENIAQISIAIAGGFLIEAFFQLVKYKTLLIAITLYRMYLSYLTIYRFGNLLATGAGNGSIIFYFERFRWLL